MGEDRQGEGTPEGRQIARTRLKKLIEGLESVLGVEETRRLLSDSLVTEEIVAAAKRHTVAEIDAAIADAKARGAVRWAWVVKRLESGPLK